MAKNRKGERHQPKKMSGQRNRAESVKAAKAAISAAAWRRERHGIENGDENNQSGGK
jgi:hypothetical protein